MNPVSSYSYCPVHIPNRQYAASPRARVSANRQAVQGAHAAATHGGGGGSLMMAPVAGMTVRWVVITTTPANGPSEVRGAVSGPRLAPAGAAARLLLPGLQRSQGESCSSGASFCVFAHFFLLDSPFALCLDRM
eukprot:SAG31_NODE_1144_length_9687_cov_10.800167_6_plen_134_part_00